MCIDDIETFVEEHKNLELAKMEDTQNIVDRTDKMLEKLKQEMGDFHPLKKMDKMFDLKKDLEEIRRRCNGES